MNLFIKYIFYNQTYNEKTYLKAINIIETLPNKLNDQKELGT